MIAAFFELPAYFRITRVAAVYLKDLIPISFIRQTLIPIYSVETIIREKSYETQSRARKMSKDLRKYREF